MKTVLQQLLHAALGRIQKEEGIAFSEEPAIQVEMARDKQHGDYASNLALLLAKEARSKPRDLAEKIVNYLPESGYIERVEVAGPGFINFFLTQQANLQIIKTIHTEGEAFGRSDHGADEKITVEFVSANPTGPLHIGHGRGAAYGAAVANLLEAVGYGVDREYYINDAGRQMDILAVSVWVRYLNVCGLELTFPKKAYQGSYIINIADNIRTSHGMNFYSDAQEQLTEILKETDEEKQLDRLIDGAKKILGQDDYRQVLDIALDEILADIRTDLEEFGVVFNHWFSERSLTEEGRVEKCIRKLEERDQLYKKDGATWFKSSRYGDEKDRVVVRDNGQATYFASDIAYHQSKLERGYDRAINIWGADHHGYIARIRASLMALGEDANRLDIRLVQFASLYRGKEKLPMSTRSGQYVTLRELRDEVGRDAARFFYVMRKSEQHLDFDLELAKSESSDNPVYYIQYAHARVCSVMEQMKQKGFSFDSRDFDTGLEQLTEPHETSLLTRLAEYPGVLHSAAITCEPHQIGYYLRDLANEFHTYYNACQFLVESDELRHARLLLITAVRQVIRNALALLGVSAPATM